MDALQIVLLILFFLSGAYVIWAVLGWLKDGTANLVPVIISLLLLVLLFGGANYGGPEWMHNILSWINSQVMNAKDYANLDVSDNVLYALFGMIFVSLIALIIGVLTFNKSAIRSAWKLFFAGVLLTLMMTIMYPNIDWGVISDSIGMESKEGEKRETDQKPAGSKDPYDARRGERGPGY